MEIKTFYDEATYTLTYVLYVPGEPEAVIVDPVWDFDEASGRLSESSIKEVMNFLNGLKLTPLYCLETHAHADHLSGSQLLKRAYPDMNIAISERIKAVQKVFIDLFHIGSDLRADGSVFDLLLKDYETIKAGKLSIKVLPTPGHTPACSSYLVEDAVFTGDALFMPDYGTGRCDFPKGSARDLYRSITQEIYSLPDSTRVFVGHDYQPGGRELQYESTVGDEKSHNIQLKATTKEEDFVTMRESRDKTLKAPRLLLPSIQVNIRAGHLPPKEDNGIAYLKLPLTQA